jgi:hypothetical protein
MTGSIEWSYQYNGGLRRECQAATRSEAEEIVRDFEDDDSGKWADVTLTWRTAAVPAGPWTEYRAGDKAGGTLAGDASPEVIADILGLAARVIPPEVIATWTPAERERAAGWASAENFSADGNLAQRVPEPPFLARAAEICASPTLAQLAVEAWTARLTHLEGGEHPGAELHYEHGITMMTARDAITGLLVLLRDRQPSPAGFDGRLTVIPDSGNVRLHCTGHSPEAAAWHIGYHPSLDVVVEQARAHVRAEHGNGQPS